MLNPLTSKTGGMLASLLLLGALAASSVQAKECFVSRDQVLDDIKQGLSGQELQERYAGCKDLETPSFSKLNAVLGTAALAQPASKLTIKNTGSTFWEAITSCGYHPQRKELTCPIEIRQRFGFGGPPAVQPSGSFEYVLFCVNYGFGLQPVNTNGVHVHDEVFGVSPNWYFTSVVPADQRLFSQPLNGRTLRARAILSWAIPPAGCNFNPIWGNQADFRIRLDP